MRHTERAWPEAVEAAGGGSGSQRRGWRVVAGVGASDTGGGRQLRPAKAGPTMGAAAGNGGGLPAAGLWGHGAAGQGDEHS